MNKFALGVVTALVFTTKEGGEMAKKGVKVADVIIKKKFGIDIKEILNEGNEDDEEL